MKYVGFLLLVGYSFISNTANAMTGTQLLGLCNASQGTVEYTACLMYVSGLIDGLVTADTVAPKGIRLCVPRGVTTEQDVLIVRKGLSEQPEKLHEDAGYLATWPLYGAFQCKGPK